VIEFLRILHRAKGKGQRAWSKGHGAKGKDSI